MNLAQKDVHIGYAINKKLQELRMSKTEFGRRIGIPQQNVNRILEKDTIDTGKLAKISDVLSFNFFTLFCDEEVAELRQAGRDYVERGKITHSGTEYAASSAAVSDLREQIAQLKSQLADKERIIQLLERN